MQQPAAEQREENRADIDQHGRSASVDVTFAPVERDRAICANSAISVT